MADVSVAVARAALQKLLERYGKNSHDKSFMGNEKQACQSLIVPLINDVLHWDTVDPSEFKTEESRGGKRIDYVVYNQGISQFVVEAKAPSKDIFDNAEYYKQAVDYGRSKNHDFAILTNFRQFVILACMIDARPVQAEIGRIVDLTAATDEDLRLLLNFQKELWISSGKERPLFARIGRRKRRIPVDEQLLDDMKHWREKLLTNIQKNNKFDFNDEKEFMHIEEEIQKFIDRLIFICFCEDKELYEPQLRPLLRDKMDRFAMEPGYLLGKIRKLFSEQYRKNYDSDLFDKSECDSFAIDDAIVLDVLEGLRQRKEGIDYDFRGIEADILGKTYEQFIGHVQTGKKRFKEMEDVGKRKKEGIYYTPKYIVDYIVNNTVRECIKGKTFAEINKTRILDPACGSGSFLLRAFDVLVEESEKALKRSPTYDEKKNLMLNCIHGVDLDERAVAIAKLNLSLKLAESSQPLPMLNENMRTGNSLIDDEKIAGYKAFKWEDEFKDIMNAGGFDVVIGNPPYVRQEELSGIKPYLQKNYEVYHGMADLFVYFFEREMNTLKEGGHFGMIVSNKWLRAGYGINLRRFIGKFWIEEFIDFGDLKVFPDATIYPCIILLSQTNKPNPKIQVCKMETLSFDSLEGYIKKNQFPVNQKDLGEKEWNIQRAEANQVLKKIMSSGIDVETYCNSKIYRGILTGLNEAFVIDEKTRNELVAKDKKSAEIIKPILGGSEIKKYGIFPKSKYLIFTRRGIEISKYPAIKKHLQKFEAELTPKTSSSQRTGRKPGDYKWYEIQDVIAYYKEFEKPKILWGNLVTKASFYFDERGFYVNAPGCILPTSSKYVLGILNSKLMSYFLKSICAERQGGFIEQKPVYVSKIPIKDVPEHQQQPIIKLVNSMLSLNKRFREIGDKKTEERSKIEREMKKIDGEIDELVYNLYGITDDEKKIIETALSS